MIRTMLNNETTRVRTLDFKEKTANTEPVITEKAYNSGEEDRRRVDGSTSTEDIDGEEVIKEVQKNQTTTTFQPHQPVLRRRPSFLHPFGKALPVFSGRVDVPSMCLLITFTIVINVTKHL